MGFVTPRLAGVGALVMAAAVIFGSPAGASAIPLHNTVVRTTDAVEGSVYVPSGRILRLGMRSQAVRALQRRLNYLHYYAGRVNGRFGWATMEAVWAFKEVQAGTWKPANPDIVGAAMQRQLQHPRLPKILLRRPRPLTWVQINKRDEVLVVFHEHTKIALISHISTADYTRPDGSGWITPDGRYRAWRYVQGCSWDATFNTCMWNPVFFIGYAYAIHGMPNPTTTYEYDGVPLNPASHGCVRIPMDVSRILHTLIRVRGTGGSLIYVTGPATLSWP